MKKLNLLFFCMVAVFTAHAQTGSWYIGGVVGYSTDTSTDIDDLKTTSSEWAFAPEVGTFLKDDIQLGIFLGISGNSIKREDDDVLKGSSITPTVYMRKFFKITDSFSTFGGLYLSYISGSSTNMFDDETEFSGFGARVGIGAAYSLSPRFTAVGQYGLLGFSSTSNTLNGEDSGSDSHFDIGVNTVGAGVLGQGNGSGSVFNIGIYYTLKTAD